MPPPDDRSADQARAAIQAALGQIGFTLPGSITIRRTHCGKPRCACKADALTSNAPKRFIASPYTFTPGP